MDLQVGGNIILSPYDRFHIDFLYTDADCFWPRSSGFHYHDTAELMIVKSGESSICIDDTISSVEGSYIVYFAKQVPHCSVALPNHDYERYCISLDEHYFSGDIKLPKESFIISVSQKELDALLAPTELLYKYFFENPTVYSSIMLKRRENLLNLLLDEIKELLKYRGDINLVRHKSYISDVCEYLSVHFNEQISLEHLSQQFYVSKAKLTRDFRMQFGVSVCDFIVTMRIRYAKKKLENTDMPIWKIAEECGYQSSGYFVRQFKKVTKMTPTEYRNR